MREVEWVSPETPYFKVTSNAWALVALEAWRRGINVQLRQEREYSLTFQASRYDFKLSRLNDATAREGNRISSNKQATKQALRKNGVSVPAGRGFVAPYDRKEILTYAAELGFPVALKANNWSKGKGVYSKIEDSDTLEHFLSSLIDDLGCQHLLVEKHIQGMDFRYFVVGDKVSGVTRRVRANIVGDGASTVSELIEAKNATRQNNPYLRNAPLRIDDEVEFLLSSAGLQLDSVPEKDRTVYLREKSNASAGGDSVDYTELASEASKLLAVNAIAALPNIRHGGVDLLVENPGEDDEHAAVLEINSAAEIGLHLYPAKGEARDVPKALIDLYFPGSSRMQRDSDYWYFDLKAALAPLEAGVARNVELEPIPKLAMNRWVSVRYSGQVQDIGFRRWLVRRARAAKVHGDVSSMSDGTVLARLCGTDRGIERIVSDRMGLPKGTTIDFVEVNPCPPFNLRPGIAMS